VKFALFLGLFVVVVVAVTVENAKSEFVVDRRIKMKLAFLLHTS
jgi:hypothetical protein